MRCPSGWPPAAAPHGRLSAALGGPWAGPLQRLGLWMGFADT